MSEGRLLKILMPK